MAICYVCDKRNSGSYSLKDYWRSPQTPKGMTKEDMVCYECYQKVKKDVIKYKKEHKEEIDRLNKEEKETEKEQKKKEEAEEEIVDLELSKELVETEKNFRKKGTINYQDEYCAIVSKLGGHNGELVFAHAFSKLTKEGYRLMAQDEGSSLNLGVGSAGLNSFYFFQKIEYITVKDD
jgi:hypothetical protein